MLRAAVAVALAGAALPTFAQDLPKPGDRWTAVATRDLEVLGPAPSRRLEEVARDLALGRAALLEIAGVPDHDAPYPTTVVVFRDESDLRSYHREPDGSAPTSPILSVLDRQGRLLALSLETLARDLPLARETLAGDVVDQLLATPPAWLRTGLVALAGRLEPAGGQAPAERLAERLPEGAAGLRAAASWPSPEELLGAGDGELRDAAAGFLRHLAHPRSERSSQFRRYLTLLRGGLPSGAAFEECFFHSFAGLYREVTLATERGGAPPIELAPADPGVAAAAAVTREDVLLALGELVGRATPWNTVAAELHYREVLAARPDDAAALRGVARLRELDGRHDDARLLWEQSLAADPHGVATRLLYGWSRLERFRRSVGTRRGWEDPLPAEVAAARELFRGAHTSTPPAHLLHGYGATFLYAVDGFAPGLEALERAARLLPGDDEIAADLALLRAHAGDSETAWDDWRARRGTVDPRLAAEIEKLMIEEALHSADQLLLVRQEPAAAIALVQRALAEAGDPATRAELESLLAQMHEVAVQLERDALLDRFLTAYEEARRLLAERRFDEARRLLEPFAADDLDPMVRDPARDLLRQLDTVTPP